MAFPYLTRPTISSAVRPVGDFTVAGTAADRGLDKVDPRLVDIIQKAAAGSPYDVELFSGKRNGSAGRSRHNTGNAVDIVLIDRATGKPVPNLKSSVGFPIYRDFALQVRDVQMAEYPDLENALRWGGGFAGTEGTYGAVDLMHFDIKPGGKMKGLVGGDLSAKAAWEAGLKLNPDQEKVVAGMGAGWVYSSEGQKRADGNVQFADFSGRNRDLGSPTDANNPKGLTPPASIPNAGKPVTLSAADRDAAIRTVIGESLGEGGDGQTAVAHVIRNRFVTGGGKSVAAIATDDSQFDAWNHDLVTAYGPGDPVYEETGKIVDGVFDGTAPDPTGGATFFYSGKKEPGFWSKGVTKVKTIGNHVFGVAKDSVRTVLPKPPAVAASDQYTKEQQVSRPDVVAGKLRFLGGADADPALSSVEQYLSGGPGFDFQTGGKTKTFGSMPYGEYPISPLTTAAERKAAGRSWQEDAFPLPDMVDPKMATFTDPDLKRTARAQGGRRTGMLIHSGDDIDKLLNAGCLAIPQEQWPAFKRTMLAEQARYGDLILELSPDGAVIHPKNDAPPEVKVVPAKTFIAENRAAAIPVAATAETVYLRQEKGPGRPENAVLQAELKERGFYKGEIDGKFGPGTKAALKAYQKSAGLRPDGVAGPMSLDSLGLPASRTEIARLMPDPEQPARRSLADRATEAVVGNVLAAAPTPRPNPRRVDLEPRPNPRRAAPPVVAGRPDNVPAPTGLPAANYPGAAPGGTPTSAYEPAAKPARPVLGPAGDPYARAQATIAAIKSKADQAEAARKAEKALTRGETAATGNSAVAVPDNALAGIVPSYAMSRRSPGPRPALGGVEINGDISVARRLDEAKDRLAVNAAARKPAPAVTPSPDPRDVLAMGLEPGYGRAAVMTGARPEPPARAPNVSGRGDVASRERAPWYDRALTATLPDENFIYDYVYDPTRPARAAAADAAGPVRPSPEVVASGDQPVDPLNLFGHLDKNKDQARLPGMETAADAVNALASGDTMTRSVAAARPLSLPFSASQFAETDATNPPLTDVGRAASLGALRRPSYATAPIPEADENALTGLTRSDMDLPSTVAPPPVDPDQPIAGSSAAASPPPGGERAAARPVGMLQRVGTAIEQRGRNFLTGPSTTLNRAASALGLPSTQSLFTASRQITTPVSGQTYTLGTVGNRNAIQGNGWTAVEQSDGSYSMSYG